MTMHVAAALLYVIDDKARTIGKLDHAGIADLAAALSVEGRAVEDELTALSRLERVLFGAARDDGGQFARLGVAVITEEFRLPEPVADREPDRVRRGFTRALPVGPGRVALAFHRGAYRTR